MDRYVMRHPELPGPPALVPESSLLRHKANGWIRVSDAVAEQDMDRVDVRAYAGVDDLDSKPAEPEPKPSKEKR